MKCLAVPIFSCLPLFHLSAAAHEGRVQPFFMLTRLNKNTCMFFKKSNFDCSREDVMRAQKDERCVIIDCRTPVEVANGSVNGAEVLEWMGGEFKAKSASLDKTKSYYLYCRSGNRSGQAASLLKSQGFEQVFNAGGYDGLKGL